MPSAYATSDPAPEPRPGVRSGHMPGSLNVPFTKIVDNGRLAGAGRREGAEEKRGRPERSVEKHEGKGEHSLRGRLGPEGRGAPSQRDHEHRDAQKGDSNAVSAGVTPRLSPDHRAISPTS